MSSPHRRTVLLPLVATLLLTGSPGEAKPAGLKALPAPADVSLDGVPNEYDGDWRDLTYAKDGSKPDAADLKAKILLCYDSDAIYVAAQVADDKLVAGGDHVELLLGIPGGKLHSIDLYPGVPGKRKASVKSKGRSVSGAKIVEAPTADGYSLEAKIPWSAIPSSDSIRIGYRGAVFVHDADTSTRVEAVLGSADGRTYASLPPISSASELALGSGLLRERNIQVPPRHNLLADVVGDRLKERVLIYDRFLVVLGPGYRDGEQYYYRDLDADADRDDLLRFDVQDVTGDGKEDIIMRRRVHGPSGQVEVFEVLSYHPGGDTPTPIFAQEVALEVGGGRIENDVELSGSGSRARIVLGAGRAERMDARRFERASNTGANPVLEPWGQVASQTWTIRGDRFVLSDEKTKEPERPPSTKPPKRTGNKPMRTTPNAKSWQKSSSPTPEQVYGLYKKQRDVSGAPRWDMSADLAEDDQSERLVVHNRDLIVFGPGFREGRGFGAVTLTNFERDSDLQSVTTRDVTGDGKHEIVVKGLLRSAMPEDLGGGEALMEVVFVYKLKGGQFERIFAAQVGRRVGNKRVSANLSFAKAGKIELRPGKAVGYAQDTYPWLQKTDPDGDVEPLLLPWGGIDQVRLRYDGSKFKRM